MACDQRILVCLAIALITFATCWADECQAVSESRSVAFQKCVGVVDHSHQSPHQALHMQRSGTEVLRLREKVKALTSELVQLKKQLRDTERLGDSLHRGGGRFSNLAGVAAKRKKQKKSKDIFFDGGVSTASTAGIFSNQKRQVKAEECPALAKSSTLTPRMTRRIAAKCCFGLPDEPAGSLDCAGSGGCVKMDQEMGSHCNGGKHCPDGITSTGVFFPGESGKGTCRPWSDSSAMIGTPYLHCSKDVKTSGSGSKKFTKVCTKKVFIQSYQRRDEDKLTPLAEVVGKRGPHAKVTFFMIMKRNVCNEEYSEFYKATRTICYVYKASKCVSVNAKHSGDISIEIGKLMTKDGLRTSLGLKCDKIAHARLADQTMAF